MHLKKQYLKWTRTDKVKYFFSRAKLKSFFGEGNGIGLLLLKASGPPKLYQWFKTEYCKPNYQILDIGCGSGKLLLRLKKKGFSKRIVKEALGDMDGIVMRYDRRIMVGFGRRKNIVYVFCPELSRSLNYAINKIDMEIGNEIGKSIHFSNRKGKYSN